MLTSFCEPRDIDLGGAFPRAISSLFVGAYLLIGEMPITIFAGARVSGILVSTDLIGCSVFGIVLALVAPDAFRILERFRWIAA